MDNVRILIARRLRVAWRRRWIGLGVAWLVCGVGWVGVSMIPDVFESRARLSVELGTIPAAPPLGTADASAATTQQEILQRTLLSRQNLERLICRTDFDFTTAGSSDRERLIERLATAIRVTSQAPNLVSVSYRDSNAMRAHDVVQTLLTISTEDAATGTHRSDTAHAAWSLEPQIAAYEAQLRAAQTRRAVFGARYIDTLPATGNAEVRPPQAAQTTDDALAVRLRDAIVARDALERALARTPARLPAGPPSQATNAAMAQTPAASPLQQAEEKLRLLLRKDTENHPDVIAQKQVIASLKRQQHAAEAKHEEANTAAGEAALTVERVVPNLLYERVHAKLIMADAHVAALQRQRDDALARSGKLAEAQHPEYGLIAYYERIERDDADLRRNYDALLRRLQVANTVQAVGPRADQPRLQIVDPATMPHSPVAPDRMLLVTAVLLAGLGAGLGVTILIGLSDRSFSSLDDLRPIGVPVLGGISVLSRAPVRQRLTITPLFAAAVVALIGVYGGLIVHILRPEGLI